LALLWRHTAAHFPALHLPGTSREATTADDNFFKGVKWSPDGSCLLTASEDGWCVLCPPTDCCFAGALMKGKLLVPDNNLDEDES
jgi:hypothetical protein